MDTQSLQQRTKQLALRIMHLVDNLPSRIVAVTIAHQLTRSATSIGANYLEACHGTSHADFVAKLKICEREAVETRYWLELLMEGNVMPVKRLLSLHDEVNQLIAIMSASVKTARKS